MEDNTNLSSSYKPDNKQLAKNTCVLYLRMLFTVGISFYTTRVILANLGVSDYGLYNVIGGFVSMFFMITSALSVAESRFLSFEIGHGDKVKLQQIFSTSIYIQFFLSLLIFVLGETVGLWFVNTQLTISPDRLIAANFLYQFSLLSFVSELFAVPYGALVISHEKMTIYAYSTVIKVVLGLFVALAISASPFDKLIYYGVLMMFVSFVNLIIYYMYCRKFFEESCFQKQLNTSLLKEMASFAGWSFLGGASEMLRTQGVNVLLNIFFGAPVNAARGVAVQVESTAKSFSINFLTALTPQVAKSYASGNKKEACKQTYEGCKFSFLLLYLMSLPIIAEAPILLSIWLKELPPYVIPFLRLTIIYSYFDIIVRPIRFLNNATGNIKSYQIVQSIGQFAVLPVCYVCLKMGMSPLSTLYVSIAIEASLLLPRVLLNKSTAGMQISSFAFKVIRPLVYVVLPSAISMLLVIRYLPESYFRIIVTLVVSTAVILLTSYFFALTTGEKIMLRNIINKIIKKR